MEIIFISVISLMDSELGSLTEEGIMFLIKRYFSSHIEVII